MNTYVKVFNILKTRLKNTKQENILYAESNGHVDILDLEVLGA